MPTHSPNDRPKLRYGLAAEPHQSDNVVVYDPNGIGKPVVLSPLALEVAERFEGTRTPAEIAEALKAEFPGLNVSADVVAGLAEALDGALLLDSPRLREQFNGPVRKPVCVGTYSADPDELRGQLAALFTAPGGAGLPEDGRDNPGRSLKAVLVPHMDYGRGNITYGYGFRELVENTDARVFVIVATSHYSPHRFTLSRQHFDTPLGLVETDQEYVNRIAEHYGDGLFDDPIAHVPEHSIELEVVLLQYLLAGRRPFKIVPLLTGSISDCVKQEGTAVGGRRYRADGRGTARGRGREHGAGLLRHQRRPGAHRPEVRRQAEGGRRRGWIRAARRTPRFSRRLKPRTQPRSSTPSRPRRTPAASAACRRRG